MIRELSNQRMLLSAREIPELISFRGYLNNLGGEKVSH